MRSPLPTSEAQIAEIATAVQKNCDVVDARYARENGLCTYLLGMREYYRWHAGIELGARADPREVGAWITSREQAWEALLDCESATLQLLPFGGGIDAYDEDVVNHQIANGDLVYGAGIGRFGVPVFFLARLETRLLRDGVQITIVDKEFARGYIATPAVSRGSHIVIRLDALRRWLWTRAEAALARDRKDPFRLSLAAYAGRDPTDLGIERMARGEIETLILHELGELRAGAILGPGWEEMLAQLCDRRTEIVVRAVRDLLADSLVTLPALVQRNADASLNFWRSNFDGMRRALAPHLLDAWGEASSIKTELHLQGAIAASQGHWTAVATDILAAWHNDGRRAVIEKAQNILPT